MKAFAPVLAAVALVAACGGRSTDTVLVTIPRGATLHAVAETLAVRGVIEHPGRFRLLARLTGRADRLRAGVYELPRPSGSWQALSILVSGTPALARLSLPEGLTLEETAAAIEEQIGVPAGELLQAARDRDLLARVRSPGPTLEGYLYPTTYLVRRDVSADELVRLLVGEFERRWRPEWTRRLDTLGMSRHEIVILASIIEGEVRRPADAPFVSSVYHNRLRRGMRLQADPTVAYAIGRRRRLFEKDYGFASPFNTYLVDGLPPGPINSPSVASLRAALYPPATDFLYFVAGPDGSHIFSRTYAEHLAAIRAAREDAQ